MAKGKDEIITFKVDRRLSEAMAGIPNRSEFIRNSILAALENTCPLCQGTGFLSPEQRRHWKKFAEHHEIIECDDCHAFHIICDAESKNSVRG